MKKAVATLAALLLLCSCQQDEKILALEGSSTARMEIGGQTVMAYDEATCQMAFSRTDCTFRIHTDNMSDWFKAEMSAVPASEGDEITATLTWTTSASVNKRNAALRVVKLEGDTVWLWDSDGQTGLVVRILE